MQAAEAQAVAKNSADEQQKQIEILTADLEKKNVTWDEYALLQARLDESEELCRKQVPCIWHSLPRPIDEPALLLQYVAHGLYWTRTHTCVGRETRSSSVGTRRSPCDC